MSDNIKNINVAQIQWNIGATLINDDGSKSLGFAGSINGVSNHALVIAGGANFSDKMPWEGGKKYYSDEIRILEKIGEDYVWNDKVNEKLPEPIAYCGSVSTDFGIVYVGGENEDGLSNKVFILSWIESAKRIEIIELPHLPLALISVGVTQIANVVYVVGGQGLVNCSNNFLKLDLNNKNPVWEKLSDLPIALSNTVLVGQNNQKGKSIYAIGGRTNTPSGISIFHYTVFSFNPQENKWKECAPISDEVNVFGLSAGAGLAVGEHNIVLVGGDNGIVFNQIETYFRKLSKPISDEDRLTLIAAKNKLLVNHKGFYNGILIYDTFKNHWSKIGELSYPTQVTTTAINWDGDIVLPSGEIKPGIRTPNIIVGKIMN